MPDNSELKRLHDERLARMGKDSVVATEKGQEKEQEQEPVAFECPVCYTDGAEFGTASPACGHKLCLSCYSNILMRGQQDTKCPCCRKPYFKAAINADVEEADPYYGLPPLIPGETLSAVEHVWLSRMFTADFAQGVQLLNLITDMGNIANRLDDLIEPPEQQEMS